MISEEKIRKLIYKSFTLFLFLAPLILTPYNSELFEFNKTILTYFFASLILALWLIRMIIARKIIFRRSFFDLPLILFLLTQTISTIFSLHPPTSIWGYYSRFHQGLSSTVAYLILFWAYLSNLSQNEVKKTINISLISGMLVAFWGILEHFGHSLSCLMITGKFDVLCWVQDVQNRVFATLGQPNWLAAYLDILIFINFFFLFKKNSSSYSFKFLFSHSLFYTCLLFTKSRSGLAGFIAGLATIYFFAYLNRSFQKTLNFSFFWLIETVILTFLIGLPFKYDLKDILRIEPPQSELNQISTATQSAILITPSEEIRKIIWQGAISLWQKYPIFGTGTETFAYTYYWVRPAEHNLTSEWDFVYNKAHNEYLNFLANNGSFGLITYLLGPLVFLTWGMKKLRESKKNQFLIAFLAAYTSLLVTNFFGFSVVLVALWFYFLPAISFLLISQEQLAESPFKKIAPNQSLKGWQKLIIGLIMIFSGWLIIQSLNYWLADYYYNKAGKEQVLGHYQKAAQKIRKAIELRPKEAIYWSEAAELYANIAFLIYQTYQEKNNWQSFAQKVIEADQKALMLNPFHLNLYRQSAKNFYILSKIDPQFLNFGLNSLLKGINLAPTDAKLYYNAGLMYQALTEKEKGEEYLKKAVELKPNYEAARLALSQLYLGKEEKEKAKEQLKFILERINPQSEQAKKMLEGL